jgi:hypothetical protein
MNTLFWPGETSQNRPLPLAFSEAKTYVPKDLRLDFKYLILCQIACPDRPHGIWGCCDFSRAFFTFTGHAAISMCTCVRHASCSFVLPAGEIP